MSGRSTSHAPSEDRREVFGESHEGYDYVTGHNLNVIQTQSGEEDGPLYDNEQANGTGYYYLPAKPKAKYCNVIDFGVGIIKPDWLVGAAYLGEEKSGIYDCYKWEQGEIPEAHSRFLGLRRDTDTAHDSQQMRQTHLGADDEFLILPNEKGGNEASARELQQRDDAGVSLRGGRGRDRGGERERGEEGPFLTYWSEKRTGRPVKWVFFSGGQFEVIRFDPGATMHEEMLQIPGYCF
eukprot:jgi/Undpi1/12570/HiC_scaffold_6.g02239.m1